MIHKSIDNNSVVITCSCGCEDGITLKLLKDGDLDFISLSMIHSKWYSEQDGLLRIIGKKLKRIWCILRNKEYYWTETVIDKSEWDEFIEAVNNIGK